MDVEYLVSIAEHYMYERMHWFFPKQYPIRFYDKLNQNK